MPRAVAEKSSFAAGQIDVAARKDKTKTIYDGGLASALNYRIMVGGSRVKRRPATRRRAALSNGKSILREFVLESGSIFKVIFSNTQFDVYNSSNVLVDTVTSCPWGSSILDELYTEVFEDQILVTHRDFWPQVISTDTAETSWATANLDFASAPGGGTAQPYWNFQTPGTTLQPSALTGSITLTTSAAHFDVSDHVNTIFRYGGKEILITATASSTSATGTVLQDLPPTVTVSLTSTTGFLVDESVQGVDSGARGVITAVAGTQLTIVMLSGLTGFTSGEILVGDGGSQSTITAGPTNTTPAAILDWDEQAISAVRGYPGGCAIHRQRLYLFNFNLIPRAVAASAAGFSDDFSIGADDGDGFMELVPDFEGQRVMHVVTADQGLVITDRATYFMPEYGTQVVTPSTIEFKLVSAVGAAAPKPAQTERGVMFIEAGSNRIMGIVTSGNVQTPWEAVDISAFWTDLMTGPRSVVADINNSNWPERYAFVVNDDGTAVCLKFDAPDSPVPVGWTPWQTNGDFRSIAPVGGSLFAIVQRSINSVSTWLLEEFEDAIYLDGGVDYTGVADTLTEYANATVDVMHHRKSLGQYAVNASGILTDFDEPDHTQDFTVTIAVPGVFTAADHGLEANQPIQLSTTGALPTGLSASTTYYVLAQYLTANTFRVSATLGGTAITTTGSQSGTHTLKEIYVAGLDMVTELDDLAPKINHPFYVQGKRYGVPEIQAHVMDACAYRLNGTLNPSYRAGESLDAQPALRTESKMFKAAGKASDLGVQVRQTVPAPVSFTGFSYVVAF